MKLLSRFKLRFSKQEIALFNAKWPGSTLRATRAYWFEFDERGNLIDTDVPEHDDGYAAAALAHDAARYIFDDVQPEWLPHENDQAL